MTTNKESLARLLKKEDVVEVQGVKFKLKVPAPAALIALQKQDEKMSTSGAEKKASAI